MTKHSITSFYRFHPLDSHAASALESALETLAKNSDLQGLILIGSEGFNGTVSGSLSTLASVKTILATATGLSDLTFKDSESSRPPFQKFTIKIKSEIVTLGRTDLVPKAVHHRHLSPSEWHQAMQDPDTVILDTRNDYEVDIGKFKNARDFRTKEFQEFPQSLKESGIRPEQKVLIYCTGGIRCEKAILAMEEQGFNNVHQLDGGILNYLKAYPEGDFEGECFVFDYRVALDSKLEPSRKYTLCPHCGQPATGPAIQCIQCGRDEIICSSCITAGECTCCKNCSHHRKIGSKSRRIHMDELRKRQR